MNNRNIKDLMFLIFIITVIPFVLPGYYLNIFVFIGLNSLMALGLLILIGYTGQISLGHAGFYAIGAYASAILSTAYNISPWFSIVLAVLITAVVGLIVGIPALRLSGYYLALATLAFGLIIFRVILELYQLTGGAIGLRNIPRLTLGDFVFKSDLSYYILVWVVVIIVFTFLLKVMRSPYGAMMKGVHADETVSSVSGINVKVLKLKVFVFSTALAGLAGALYSHYITYVGPDSFTVEVSILILLMVIIGGSQHPWGGIVGAVILTIMPEYLRAYRDIAIGTYGLILMLLILYMPNGIAPLLEKLFLSLQRLISKGGSITK
ncbi:MAG: branched-chain amino acid ABC transporter permease [Clostridia bacterium]|nr:branched-chain amino acid ABC transporter permease [Clostridia bacterium]